MLTEIKDRAHVRPVEDPNAFDYRFAMKRVTVLPAPEALPRESSRIQAFPLRGATVANLSPAVAEELGLEIPASARWNLIAPGDIFLAHITR
jgi:hypothetical protein